MKDKAYCLCLFLTAVLLLGGPVHGESYPEAVARGNTALQNGDDETAINAYTLAKSIAPSGVNDARLRLARLYKKLARFSDAEVEYQAMISSAAQTKGHDIKDLKNELASLYVDQGKFRSAQSIYQDMISEDPHDSGALYNLAVCMEATDNLDSAKDVYQRVIDLDPLTHGAAQARNRLARLDKATTAISSGQFFPMDPDFGAAGLGWWNLKKMPIHVYIDDGTHVKGYRNSMRNHVTNALSAWQQASHGHLSFVVDSSDAQGEQQFKNALGDKPILSLVTTSSIPADPIKTGIHFHWVDSLSGQAAGVAWTDVFGQRAEGKGVRKAEITQGHVWIATNSQADGRPLPEANAVNAALFDAQDRLMAEVAVHELGHALGLIHSSNPGDIMCSGVFALNSKDSFETRTLSTGDIKSLTQHYDGFQGTGMPESGQVTIDTDDQGRLVIYSQGQGRAVLPRAVQLGSTGNTEASPSGPRPPQASPRPTGPYQEVLFDINTGDYAAGQMKLDKLLTESPNTPTALYLRAITHVMQKKYPEATSDYQQVIKLSPGSELAVKAQEGLRKIRRQ